MMTLNLLSEIFGGNTQDGGILNCLTLSQRKRIKLRSKSAIFIVVYNIKSNISIV